MDLSNKVAVVTGANSGIGYETALDLYRKGATVFVASRNEEKATRAIADMKSEGGDGRLVYVHLDLSSLRSVRACAEEVLRKAPRLDFLVNNAGVMIPPPAKTEDGFELQFGVNFVGHYALTGHLFELLAATPGARVVTLSSLAHRGAGIDFDNFRGEKGYVKWREYGQSKLADLVFALEFDRRLRNGGYDIKSLAAHPGYSKTELQVHMDEDTLASLDMMSARGGAQPTLAACLRRDAEGGQYWGPDGPKEQKGEPALAKIDNAVHDEDRNARLWDWAKGATGAEFPF